MTTIDPTVAPVLREIVVAAPVATCFDVFVDGFASWWPPEHHLGENRTITAFFIEPFEGGRCYDVDTDGGESHWGTVLAIDPPDRLVFAWHVQGDWTLDRDPARQSEVEVTFTAIDDTTSRVRLEHRNLERHGATAEGVQAGIGGSGGWSWSLARFADIVEGRAPRALPTSP
ncbi:MAG: hypothetical protein JWN46_525 [Acidimicrobiales bacterium]|nr:hypothetical protein [Acidimicrobiales bacterium]